jgi:rod shape-determining protein MreC
MLDDRNYGMRQFARALKALFSRIFVVMLFATAFGFLLLSRGSDGALGKVRSVIISLADPVLTTFSFGKGKDGASNGSFFSVYEENTKLRTENEKLQRVKNILAELSSENKRLRKVVGYNKFAKNGYKIARVVGSVVGDYSGQLVIDMGSNDGVKEGSVVFNRDGLIGKIIDISKNSSTVSIITNTDSRIPVMTQRYGEQAILKGDGSDRPKFAYIAKNNTIREGDIVVTSGSGELFPPSIPIGVVVSDSSSQIAIKPFVDWHRLDSVFIPEGNNIDFDIYTQE